MPTPYEAPSLVRLHTAEKARWPGTESSYDGWIGDAAHASRTSDHNPDPVTGVVRARDAGVKGRHKPTMIAARLVHPATQYVIHNRRIWSRTRGMTPATYTGDDPHTYHIHESEQHTLAAENSKVPWLFIDHMPLWPLLELGAKGEAVRQLQAYLNGYWYPLALDGDFGPKTAAALSAFQVRFNVANSVKVVNGVRVGDGRAGAHTRQALWVS